MPYTRITSVGDVLSFIMVGAIRVLQRRNFGPRMFKGLGGRDLGSPQIADRP